MVGYPTILSSLMLSTMNRSRARSYAWGKSVLGLLKSVWALVFDGVVVLVMDEAVGVIPVGFCGWLSNYIVFLAVIDDESISREIVRLEKVRSRAAEVRLVSGFRWRRRIGDGRDRGGGSGEFLWWLIFLWRDVARERVRWFRIPWSGSSRLPRARDLYVGTVLSVVLLFAYCILTFLTLFDLRNPKKWSSPRNHGYSQTPSANTS